ncbi:MAG: phosphatidate cytidylyltransferase [Candidatus Aminicenantes bacterium]|nr:MAG: phosphatidate cytidylyltransferase [Candidatus Aminicenantes bacterium]
MSLGKRTFTALPLIGTLFVVVQYSPDWAFFLFGQGFILAALVEFYNLAERKQLMPQKVLGCVMALLVSLTFYFPGISLEIALFSGLLVAAVYFVATFNTLEKLPFFPASFAVTVVGMIYISFPLNFLFRIRVEDGPFTLYFLFAVIFLGDTGAYFIGKPFGRKKMTPIASPNKTWEGSAGGILFALGGAVLARTLLLPEVPLWLAAASGVVVHAAAQVSDPLESLFKRAVGVKDSSNVLPGHGGFFDRIDSLILAGPLFYFIVKHFWK